MLLDKGLREEFKNEYLNFQEEMLILRIQNRSLKAELELKELQLKEAKEQNELLEDVIADLEYTVDQQANQIRTKKIAIQESGSIAEAALKLNKVFEAAQAAAEQYLMNIKQQADNQSAGE